MSLELGDPDEEELEDFSFGLLELDDPELEPDPDPGYLVGFLMVNFSEEEFEADPEVPEESFGLLDPETEDFDPAKSGFGRPEVAGVISIPVSAEVWFNRSMTEASFVFEIDEELELLGDLINELGFILE